MLESLSCGRKLRVTATVKGKGFMGVMKRHGMKGGPATHGHKSHRRVGSIGPLGGRVWKGRRMPGRVPRHDSTHWTRVLDQEGDVLTVMGSVPGPSGALVRVRTG